jgi:hypothetical protein
MLAGTDAKLGDLIEQVQFNIRVVEHQQTATQLVKDILQMTGYSSETFGIYDGGGPTRTATEIESKQQRSLLTRDRKIRLWVPALTRLLQKLLAIDSVIFGTPGVPALNDIDVVFADGVQESQLDIAQTVQALRSADAASDEVIVGMVHPDWDQDKIVAEVALIRAQKPAALPDPMFMHPGGGQSASTDPNGLSNAPDPGGQSSGNG